MKTVLAAGAFVLIVLAIIYNSNTAFVLIVLAIIYNSNTSSTPTETSSTPPPAEYSPPPPAEYSPPTYTKPTKSEIKELISNGQQIYMYATATASERKLIREMGSTQLETYLQELWIKSGKNTGLLLLNYPNAQLLKDCYKQLTGNDLLLNVNNEFTNDVIKIRESGI